MADLANEFTWSVSRDNLFRSCRRAYYYQYYGSWNGWNADADEKNRLLYLLKNIKSLPAWTGTIVHETIAEALRDHAETGRPVMADDLKSRAKEKLRRGWTEATTKAWLRQPKKTNLDELYYGNGQSLAKEKTDKVKEKVYGCLDAFAAMPELQDILRLGPASWKPIDKLDSFDWQGTKIWCAVDFALKDPEGNLRIIDWKTGAEKTEALGLQLACYAHFAHDKWGAPPGTVKVYGCFLGEGARFAEYPLSPDGMVDAQERILTSIREMQQCLDDPARNIAHEQDFPLAENSRPCRFCVFRGACPQGQATLPPGPP